VIIVTRNKTPTRTVIQRQSGASATGMDETGRRPRPDVRFERCGTLHCDGISSGPPMNPIKLRPDGMSIGVGIKMASKPFPG
jgi:hypothetical protein